jgi:RNA polymerase sigma factor (sigma-70 family)
MSKDKKQPDEAKLLKRAQKLDQEALTCIYQNYRDAIYRYVYHHLGNAQTAEDLTSDVFRRFLQALRNGGGPNRQLKAWLYRVAHNLIVDELRRRKHRNHKSLDETLDDTLRDDAVGLDRLVGDAIAERVRYRWTDALPGLDRWAGGLQRYLLCQLDRWRFTVVDSPASGDDGHRLVAA